MKTLFHKPYRWARTFSLVLALASTFILLDAFVIPQVGTPVSALAVHATASVATSSVATANDATASVATATAGSTTETTEASDQGAAGETDASARSDTKITANSYQDENIQITISTVREYDTNIYVADIKVSSPEYLKTAFANDTFGRNIKAVTSAIAAENNAIFAINGDYYGFRTAGFVLRNGVLYRDTAQTSVSDEGLVIDSQGNFSIVNESESDAQQLADAGAWQILSFGPSLINKGQITVSASSEVGQSMASNPRTAIGQVSDLHYIVVVSDGRTSDNAGLSLLELAQVMQDNGCTVAYNLDGGGSSTMWFNGQVVNNPTDGKSNGERQVSDIVYFGY